jgi:hypothetical protein
MYKEKVYEKNSAYYFDVIYSIKDNVMYKGNSTYYFDAVCNFSEDLTEMELYAVVYLMYFNIFTVEDMQKHLETLKN